MTDILRATGRFEMVARFVRLFSLGSTVTWIVAGLGSGRGEPGVSAVAAAVGCGIAFHVFADVGNDVCDLPLDRTDPRRARGPLVTGAIRPQPALWLALAALPVAAAFIAGTSRSGRAALALAVAVALLALYNVAGKAWPIPFAADIGQGAGWAALVWLGAELTGGPGPATTAGMVYVAAYVAMVNGVHGALRDVGNDRAQGARTTAVLLGADIVDGAARVPPALTVYAAVLQLAAWGALGVAAVTGGFGAVATAVAAVLSVAAAVSAVSAHRYRDDLRRAMAHGTRHLALAAAAPAALFAGGLPGWAVAVAVAVFVAPLVLYDRALRGLRFDLPSTAGTAPQLPPPLGDRIRVVWAMTRPGTWMAAGILACIGARHAAAPWREVLAVALPVAFGVAAANVFNDRCDAEADRVTRPDRPLVTGALPEVSADRAVLVLGVAGFGCGALLGPGAAVVSGALVALGLAYSLVLRRWVLTGAPMVALLFAATPVLGAVFAGRPVPAASWWAAALVLVFLLAREVLMGVPDVAGDRAAGYRTVASVLGAPAARAGFRAGLGLFAVLVLVPAVAAEAGTAYTAAALVCGVAPAVLAVARLGPGTTDRAVASALHTTGLMFAAGLVPIALL